MGATHGRREYPESELERCEIRIASHKGFLASTGFGDPSYWLEAVALGPRGSYIVSKSRKLGRDPKENDSVLDALSVQLMQSGWQPATGVPFNGGLFSARTLPAFMRRVSKATE